MNQPTQRQERHYAPDGRKKNTGLWLLLACLVAALLLVMYLLLFHDRANHASAAERADQPAPSQLHTRLPRFEMPVFEAPEPDLAPPDPAPEPLLPEPVTLAVPAFKLDPLPGSGTITCPGSLADACKH